MTPRRFLIPGKREPLRPELPLRQCWWRKGFVHLGRQFIPGCAGKLLFALSYVGNFNLTRWNSRLFDRT